MISVNVDLGQVERDFSNGLLVDLLGALQRVPTGGLFALRAPPHVAPALEQWAALSGCSVVERVASEENTRFVIRSGEVVEEEPLRPIGSRLWLYANFDCNLRCDYCCVRSSPHAERRALGLQTVQRVMEEAPSVGAREVFVTGGEPFLLPDIHQILHTCAQALPTTVLTNAMLLKGQRLAALEALPRDRLTLQVSLDSPDPQLHDLHRGVGSWQRAYDGVMAAQKLGFRVRLAATVSTDEQAASFTRFLDAHHVAKEDRVIRRVALRGLADGGVALARGDLHPEMTLTARGVYWHPVGADDDDFLVTPDVFPLQVAAQALRDAHTRARETSENLSAVFRCA